VAKETKRLKKNDEVYIKSLGLYGKVLGGLVAGEREEDQFYTVQIIRHCRPTDLELIDREAEREKRDAELQKKADRFARARQNIAARGDISEALAAFDDLWQTLGHDPFLRRK
jgi:uncharacterized protein YozE (UPF0346 family)